MSSDKRLLVRWLLVVPYILLLYVSLFAAMQLRYGVIPSGAVLQNHLIAFTGVHVLWLLVFYARGLFEVETLRSWRTVWFSLLSAMVVNGLVAVVYFYFQPSLILTPRRFLLLHSFISAVLLGLWHSGLAQYMKRRLREPLYLFSASGELEALEQILKTTPLFGFKLIEHFRGLSSSQAEQIEPGSVVVLPDLFAVNPAATAVLYDLRLKAVRFYNYRAFYEHIFRRIYLVDVDQMWFLHNIDYKRRRFYDFAKRLIDLFVGFVGSIIFIITFPVVAAAIKFSSPGSILFIQNRIGKNGVPFAVYKYRTMSGGPTDTWTAVGDPRVTRLGTFLRKSRLDELPQFINVLRGTMSLVGPRPEQPHLVEQLRQQIPFYDERHLVKPGITGWAQLHVYAGNVEETRTKLQYDLYYIKHRSALFDLEIILKTIYFICTWSGR